MKRGLLPRRKLPRPSRNSSGSCPSPSSRPSCVGIGLNDLLLDVWRHAMSFVGQSRHFGDVRVTIAVGTRVTSRPPHRSVRAQFGHTACMGLSLSTWRHAILVVLCIPFFCSTRAASILPSRPHISIAVARSGGQGRRFFSAAEG